MPATRREAEGGHLVPEVLGKGFSGNQLAACFPEPDGGQDPLLSHESEEVRRQFHVPPEADVLPWIVHREEIIDSGRGQGMGAGGGGLEQGGVEGQHGVAAAAGSFRKDANGHPGPEGGFEGGAHPGHISPALSVDKDAAGGVGKESKQGPAPDLSLGDKEGGVQCRDDEDVEVGKVVGHHKARFRGASGHADCDPEDPEDPGAKAGEPERPALRIPGMAPQFEIQHSGTKGGEEEEEPEKAARHAGPRTGSLAGCRMSRF